MADRLTDTIRGHGRPLVIPLMGFPGIQLNGSTLKQNTFNWGTQFSTVFALQRRFRPDGIFFFMDLSVEAEAFGATVSFSAGEVPTIPAPLVDGEESALALTRKFRPPQGALLANIDDLLHRFGNRALGDTILRLGRDPLRKLSPGDRLTGAAVNALAQGVTPVHLVTGIAAGLRFAHAGDPVAQALQARIGTDGIEKVASEVTGLAARSPLLSQVLARYAALG